MTYLCDVIEAAVDGVGRVDEREDVVKDGGRRLLAEHVQHRDEDVGQKRRLSIKKENTDDTCQSNDNFDYHTLATLFIPLVIRMHAMTSHNSMAFE